MSTHHCACISRVGPDSGDGTKQDQVFVVEARNVLRWEAIDRRPEGDAAGCHILKNY